MKSFQFKRVGWLIRPCWAGLLTLLSGATAIEGQESVIHLKDGGRIEARIVDLETASLSYRAALSTSNASMPYSQIDRVEFPPPDEWTRAMQFFEFDRFAEAAPMFEKIAQRKGRSSGYPAPGNFASLAQRRLVDCFRRLGDSAGVAKELSRIEPEKLPIIEREIPPVLNAWAAAGSEDWDRVVEIATAAAAGDEFSNASEQGIELAYLKGLALKESGQPGEAVIAFATAYTLNAATDFRISRAALEEAAAIVEKDPDRFSEFQAQIHLYASIFGKGDVWAEASSRARRVSGEAVSIGEAALGQAGRTETEGEFMEETFGLEAIEQVTADHMKKIGINRKAAGATKKK